MKEHSPSWVDTIESVNAICEVGDCERELLCSPHRPIVLLRARQNNGLAGTIAPRNPNLGVMLPYTSLHYLILREMNGVPLVMTSGNHADEPITYLNDDSIERLGNIADAISDAQSSDSRALATTPLRGSSVPMNRSCGDRAAMHLRPIQTAISATNSPLLAVGGQFKSTFAIGRD